jgi:hypothetical protein
VTTTHRLGPVAPHWGEADFTVGTEPSAYSVWCSSCETDIIGPTEAAVMILATEHATPGMGSVLSALLDE